MKTLRCMTCYTPLDRPGGAHRCHKDDEVPTVKLPHHDSGWSGPYDPQTAPWAVAAALAKESLAAHGWVSPGLRDRVIEVLGNLKVVAVSQGVSERHGVVTEAEAVLAELKALRGDK